MNLADIRKKAEDNRKPAADQFSGGAVEAVPFPEVDASAALTFEEPALNRFAMPAEDLSADPCIDDAQLPEYSDPVTESAV